MGDQLFGRIALRLVVTLAEFVGLAGLCAMARYLSKLALRLPDPKLAARARFNMWGLATTITILLAGFLLESYHSIIKKIPRGRGDFIQGDKNFRLM